MFNGHLGTCTFGAGCEENPPWYACCSRVHMLLLLLIVLLLLALGGGGWGHSRYGYAGWTPAGIIVLVLVILLFTGRLQI